MQRELWQGYIQVTEILQMLDLVHPQAVNHESPNIREGHSFDSIS